jgi:hypothetical protein
MDWQRLDTGHAELSGALRRAVILNSVGFNCAGALVSTCHPGDVVDETLAASASALEGLA